MPRGREENGGHNMPPEAGKRVDDRCGGGRKICGKEGGENGVQWPALGACCKPKV